METKRGLNHVAVNFSTQQGCLLKKVQQEMRGRQKSTKQVEGALHVFTVYEFGLEMFLKAEQKCEGLERGISSGLPASQSKSSTRAGTQQPIPGLTGSLSVCSSSINN